MTKIERIASPGTYDVSCVVRTNFCLETIPMRAYVKYIVTPNDTVAKGTLSTDGWANLIKLGGAWLLKEVDPSDNLYGKAPSYQSWEVVASSNSGCVRIVVDENGNASPAHAQLHRAVTMPNEHPTPVPGAEATETLAQRLARISDEALEREWQKLVKDLEAASGAAIRAHTITNLHQSLAKALSDRLEKEKIKHHRDGTTTIRIEW